MLRDTVHTHNGAIYCSMISTKAAFIKRACILRVIFQTFPGGSMKRHTYLHSLSAATESLIHPERGIELSQDEDMTSWAYLMSVIGQLTCRSGMLPASSPWVLNAASEQRPTTQMTSGEARHLLLKDTIIKVGHTGTPALTECVCVCVRAEP